MDSDAQRELTVALNARREGRVAPIQLRGRDLSGLQAIAADLSGAELSDTDLEGACLAGAHLARANLEGADLRDVDLGGADLTEANLKYANLTGARLDDTVLAGADLRGACLSEVTGDPLSLAGAKIDKSAIKRSGYRMREVAQLVIRGADVNEKETLPSRIPPASTGDRTPAAPPSAPALGAGPRAVSAEDTGRSWLASIGPLLGSLRPGRSRTTAGPGARVPSSHAERAPGGPSDAAPDSLDAPSTPVGALLSANAGVDLASEDLRLPRTGVPLITAYDPDPGPTSAEPVLAPSDPPAIVAPEEDFDADLPTAVDHARERLRHSILPVLRRREASSRSKIADMDDEIPASLRSFRAMDALIREAGASLVPAKAPSGSKPSADARQVPTGPLDATLEGFRLPRVGEEFLGVKIEEELLGGTTARSFRGTMSDGGSAVVKVFDPNSPGADLQMAAFQRGVRALCRVQALDHRPHLRVAELLAVSTDQLAYVVRNYDNGSIENIVDVAITMKGGLEMFQTICESVAELHEEGVLVRAIKPSNILIDGLTPLIGEVDMVDLPGLSQVLDNTGGYASYVAPEERLGKGTRSPTADVYALGKLLEYLLTGHEPIAPVGAKPIIADRKGTPAVLVQLVSRCLAPDPADRYQYVSELLADLHAFQKRGDKATLQASIRPGALSRLKSGPSIAPKAKQPRKAKEERAAPAEAVQPDRWLSRRAEKLLAAMGLLLGAFGCGVFYFAPSGVSAMESAGYLLAVVLGFATWLLPRPRGRIIFQRIGLWAAGASLVLLLDPVTISVLRWQADLDGGAAREKENAVTRLTRLGHRDFSGRKLSGISLNRVDLGNTKFIGADLTDADLSQTFLVEADFSSATLTNLKVFGANLQGATFDEAKDLATVECDRYTSLPETAYCHRGHLRLRRTKK